MSIISQLLATVHKLAQPVHYLVVRGSFLVWTVLAAQDPFPNFSFRAVELSHQMIIDAWLLSKLKEGARI